MRCWSLRQSVKKLERRIWQGGTNLAKALFKKVLEYAGDYRKLTYASVIVMLFGVAVSVLPLLFAWQIITPLMGYGEMDVAYVCLRVAAIAVCGISHGKYTGKRKACSASLHSTENVRSYTVRHFRNTIRLTGSLWAVHKGIIHIKQYMRSIMQKRDLVRQSRSV